MPNWCENRLEVSGDKEQLTAFKRKARGKKTAFSLEKFVPMPRELEEIASPPQIVPDEEYRKKYREAVAQRKKDIEGKETMFLTTLPITKKMSEALIKKYGADNWYDWNIMHWGTKWDVFAQLYSRDDTLIYTFDSAWSPPIKAFEVISEQFPKLNFHMQYDEPGVGFFGVMVAANGIVKDCCENYPDTSA